MCVNAAAIGLWNSDSGEHAIDSWDAQSCLDRSEGGEETRRSGVPVERRRVAPLLRAVGERGRPREQVREAPENLAGRARALGGA
jgi:hypothetical protein